MKLSKRSFLSVVLIITLIGCSVTSAYADDKVLDNTQVKNEKMSIDLAETLKDFEVKSEKKQSVADVVVGEEINEKISIGTILSTEETDGIVWTVVKNGEGNVSIINETTKELTNLVYDTADATLLIEKYSNDMNSKGYEKETISLTTNGVKSVDNIEGRAISYATKITETMHNKYWYQNGYDGAKDYVKIGCVATYKIRLDNLSNSRYTRCNDYRTDIRVCKSNYNKYLSYLSTAGLSAEIVAALIVTNILFPVTTIATVIVGMFGSVTLATAINAVDSYMDAKDAYDSAVTTYAEIKLWGTKL